MISTTKKKQERPRASIKDHLLRSVPMVQQQATLKNVLSMLEKFGKKYDSVDCIYVIDHFGSFLGFFYVKELFHRPKDALVASFLTKGTVTAHLEMELEKAAHLALQHNLIQVPVVKDKKLIGVVSSREILSTINRSLRKDIFHFAGIHHSHLDFQDSMEIPFFKAVRGRLSWLIVGFIGAMLMAVYIGLFEETLTHYLIIASFVPAIVYISDALGTQFQTIFVRDLAVMGKALDIKKYFLRHMAIGALIAVIIAALLFSSIWLIWGQLRIALIISLASVVTLTITSFTALFTTLLIRRFKFDPALGSGPIATIISDMTSVIIYFVIVVLFI